MLLPTKFVIVGWLYLVVVLHCEVIVARMPHRSEITSQWLERQRCWVCVEIPGWPNLFLLTE